MCIIADACNASLLARRTDRPEVLALRNALKMKRTKLVVGGKLHDELKKVTSMRLYMVTLSRAGVLRVFRDIERLNQEARDIERDGIRSNDSHIIALARLTHTSVPPHK